MNFDFPWSFGYLHKIFTRIIFIISFLSLKSIYLSKFNSKKIILNQRKFWTHPMNLNLPEIQFRSRDELLLMPKGFLPAISLKANFANTFKISRPKSIKNLSSFCSPNPYSMFAAIFILSIKTAWIGFSSLMNGKIT